MLRNDLTVAIRILIRIRLYAAIDNGGPALFTVAGHTLRVARTRPLHALRYG